MQALRAILTSIDLQCSRATLSALARPCLHLLLGDSRGPVVGRSGKVTPIRRKHHVLALSHPHQGSLLLPAQ